MFPCGPCYSWGRKSPSVILSPCYAKYIWAASMLMTIMNVSNFAENLVKKCISFLLRSIPLTTKLWFKIHNLLKSRTPLNKTVQFSDMQTFSYPRNILFSFTAICQYVLFFPPKSTIHGGLQAPFSTENSWGWRSREVRCLHLLSEEDEVGTNAAGVAGTPKIAPTCLWASVYPRVPFSPSLLTPSLCLIDLQIEV